MTKTTIGRKIDSIHQENDSGSTAAVQTLQIISR